MATKYSSVWWLYSMVLQPGSFGGWERWWVCCVKLLSMLGIKTKPCNLWYRSPSFQTNSKMACKFALLPTRSGKSQPLPAVLIWVVHLQVLTGVWSHLIQRFTSSSRKGKIKSPWRDPQRMLMWLKNRLRPWSRIWWVGMLQFLVKEWIAKSNEQHKPEMCVCVIEPQELYPWIEKIQKAGNIVTEYWGVQYCWSPVLLMRHY